MSRKSEKEIREKVLKELQIMKEMDEKAKAWHHSKEIYEAWQTLAKLARMTAFDWKTGTVYIYAGTMEALSRVLQLYSGVEIDTNITQRTPPNPQ